MIALITNICLALLKFTVGSIAGSRALIADAFNSAGDVVATLVAWLAFRYGLRPPDDDHHYGHHNAEALAGLLIGGMLCATGVFISIEGVLGIINQKEPQAPGQIAMWAAGLTAVVKAVLFRVSIKVGRETNSPTLLASARDHGADVICGLVALLGIWVARNGYPEVDSIAAAVIGVYILYLGIEPVKDNTAILMHAAPPELAEKASIIAREVEGIEEVRQTRVQPLGGSYRMDMVVLVQGKRSVEEAHEIAHAAEDLVRSRVRNITEVHIHVEPLD